MILLIDNYDSFSYNLYQLIGRVDSDIRVIRNDELTVQEIEQLKPRLIVLSPGPGKPKDAGICEEVIEELGDKIPILGVCLGHQAICEAYGGEISYAKTLMHGKSSVIMPEQENPLFQGMGQEITVGRYHSLAACEESLPNCLKILARTTDGEIMAVAHKEYPVFGVQFHPESILTPCGKQLIDNLFVYIM